MTPFPLPSFRFESGPLILLSLLLVPFPFLILITVFIYLFLSYFIGVCLFYWTVKLIPRTVPGNWAVLRNV